VSLAENAPGRKKTLSSGREKVNMDTYFRLEVALLWFG
jgi:hypothetical protein